MTEAAPSTYSAAAGTVSVVIAARNAHADIEACLQPLTIMRSRGEIAEIVVVDDCSTDDTARLATRAGADTTLSLPGQLGPAGARNAGVASSTGPIVWFVDADVVVYDNAARVLARAFDDPDIDAVFGSYGDRPTASNFLSQYKNLVHHDTHQRCAGRAYTFWTGCGGVRRAAFDAVGGFDGQRFWRTGMEDVDLGYRLAELGCRIELVAELQGEHRKRWMLLNLLRVEIFHRALPWSRLMLNSHVRYTLNIDDGERARALVAGLSVIGLCMAASPWAGWPIAVGALALVLFANRRLLGFFTRKRGVVFALRAVAFHQIYYLYSGSTFVYAWLEHRLGRAAH